MPSLMGWRCSAPVTWATSPASFHLPCISLVSFLYLHSVSSSSCTLQSAPPGVLIEALNDPTILP